jgi:hypothetical protein
MVQAERFDWPERTARQVLETVGFSMFSPARDGNCGPAVSAFTISPNYPHSCVRRFVGSYVLTLTKDQLVRITKESDDPGVFATTSAQDWINEFCSEAAIVGRVYVQEEFFRLFAVAVGFDYVQILTRGAASINYMNLHTVSCSSWGHDYVTDDQGEYLQRVHGSVQRIAHVDGNHYALVWKDTELEEIRALVQRSTAYPALQQLELADAAARSVASSVSVLPSDPQASPGITLMAQQYAKATKASPSSAHRSRSRSIGPVTSAKPAASVHATPSAQQTPSTPASAGAAQIPQGPVAYGVNQRPAKSAPKKASSKKRPVREKTEKGKKGPRAKTVDISIDPPDAPSHIPLVPITECVCVVVVVVGFYHPQPVVYVGVGQP